MNIAWYYNRLRSMSAGELCWRMRKKMGQCKDFLFHRFANGKLSLHYPASQVLLDAVTKTVFYNIPVNMPKQYWSEWLPQSVSTGQKLLKHKMNLFAIGEVDLGYQVDFNYEYKRKIHIHPEFGPWMDYRDTETYGDFKYFWEVPRLQHLICLSKAWHLTKDVSYAEEVALQLSRFSEQCPYLRGINWMMPMEAGIRLISLSWIAVFLSDYLRSNSRLCCLIEKMMKSHLRYTSSNYAAYSSANNHLVGEAAGVFVSSFLLGSEPAIHRRRREAYEILCREIIHQHHSDGVNKENGIHYQMFALDFFLQAGILGRLNGMEFPADYWNMISKSAEFLAAVSDQQGRYVQIGDSDDGKAIILSEDENEVRSLLAVSSVVCNRSVLARAAGEFDQKSFFLLGEKGLNQFNKLREISDGDGITNAYPEGGYYILGRESAVSARLIFDCGPLGFESIAAHGHADSMSIILDVKDVPFLIDPGTYIYIAKNPYRNYFRSTRAHNTVMIDSVDQSEMAGPFLWKTQARSYLQEWQSGPNSDMIVAWHDGYHRLSDPVTHRRKILFEKRQGRIVIEDFLETHGRHTVQMCFHWAAQSQFTPVSNGYIVRNNNQEIRIEMDTRLKWTTYCGSESPIWGWASDRYDEKYPIVTWVGTDEICSSQIYKTIIQI